MNGHKNPINSHSKRVGDSNSKLHHQYLGYSQQQLRGEIIAKYGSIKALQEKVGCGRKETLSMAINIERGGRFGRLRCAVAAALGRTIDEIWGSKWAENHRAFLEARRQASERVLEKAARQARCEDDKEPSAEPIREPGEPSQWRLKEVCSSVDATNAKELVA